MARTVNLGWVIVQERFLSDELFITGSRGFREMEFPKKKRRSYNDKKHDILVLITEVPH